MKKKAKMTRMTNWINNSTQVQGQKEISELMRYFEKVIVVKLVICLNMRNILLKKTTTKSMKMKLLILLSRYLFESEKQF